MMVLALTLAAGLGAACRYLLTNWGKRRWPTRPWATLLINLLGTALFALTVRLGVPTDWQLVVTTGFCGGFTTFSTFMADAVILLRDKAYGAFVAYYLLTPILGIALAAGILLLP